MGVIAVATLLGAGGCLYSDSIPRQRTVELRNLTDRAVSVDLLRVTSGGSAHATADIQPSGRFVFTADTGRETLQYLEARLKFSEPSPGGAYYLVPLQGGYEIRRDITVSNDGLVLTAPEK